MMYVYMRVCTWHGMGNGEQRRLSVFWASLSLPACVMDLMKDVGEWDGDSERVGL